MYLYKVCNGTGYSESIRSEIIATNNLDIKLAILKHKNFFNIPCLFLSSNPSAHQLDHVNVYVYIFTVYINNNYYTHYMRSLLGAWENSRGSPPCSSCACASRHRTPELPRYAHAPPGSHAYRIKVNY